ncbi:hypothetical protein [Bacillus gaemokensis]|uniref:Group-specific protein n=1 Tax=Bacillus gaemokensis TaxID=574375 RepID=A0A073KFM4_9BACI|nr:hypothetical protein [Bacillus gaemokensis]KEK26059.1 hypothetical protein BAGA_02130 [Bacillus gaemokensis]KYG38871.1 hypothetical protein AZF08_02200 [Bacillus gaemokensis]
MKKKVILFTTLLTVVGSAGIYTALAASPDQSKQKIVQKEEIKKLEKVKEEKNKKETAAKLGVSLEGKTEKEIQKELNTARFEKRHELLVEHAKQLGIETEGKKDEEIILEIGKIQHGK